MRFVLFLLFVLLCTDIVLAQFSCETSELSSGTLTVDQTVYRFQSYRKCWIIKVPPGSHAYFNLTNLSPNLGRSIENYVQVDGTHIPTGTINFRSTNAETNVTYFVRNSNHVYPVKAKCEIKYKVEHTESVLSSSEWPNLITWSTTELGIEDNGNKIEIDGLAETRNMLLEWLKDQKSQDDGWGSETAKVVTAIHLGTGNSFRNAEDRETFLDLQLKIALERLKGNKELIDLAMFINSLIAVCSYPSDNFPNLAEDLKEKLTKDGDDAPGISKKIIGYTALCNAGNEIEEEIIKQMDDILTKPIIYLELQTGAAMLLACVKRKSKKQTEQLQRAEEPEAEETTTPTTAAPATNAPIEIENLDNAIKKFKKLQKNDGSFGDVYMSAHIMQAILASDPSYVNDMGYKRGVEYLMKEMSGSSKDMTSVLLALPVLNGKSEVDIACNDSRKYTDVGIAKSFIKLSETDKKISVKLYDELIHSKTMTLIDGLTAFQFLKMAAQNDHRFRYKTRWIGVQLSVYEVSGVANNPRTGEYWQFCLKTGSDEKRVHDLRDHVIKGETELILQYKGLTNLDKC